jgi:hypothetical protein
VVVPSALNSHSDPSETLLMGLVSGISILSDVEGLTLCPIHFIFIGDYYVQKDISSSGSYR